MDKAMTVIKAIVVMVLMLTLILLMIVIIISPLLYNITIIFIITNVT